MYDSLVKKSCKLQTHFDMEVTHPNIVAQITYETAQYWDMLSQYPRIGKSLNLNTCASYEISVFSPVKDLYPPPLRKLCKNKSSS